MQLLKIFKLATELLSGANLSTVSLVLLEKAKQ